MFTSEKENISVKTVENLYIENQKLVYVLIV